MWSTIVFVVMMIGNGNNPTYTIMGYVEPADGKTAMQVCRHTIDLAELPQEQKDKLGCLEVVEHDAKGNPLPVNIKGDKGSHIDGAS